MDNIFVRGNKKECDKMRGSLLSKQITLSQPLLEDGKRPNPDKTPAVQDLMAKKQE